MRNSGQRLWSPEKLGGSLVGLRLADVAVACVVLVVARVWFRRWDWGGAYGGHDKECRNSSEDVCLGG